MAHRPLTLEVFPVAPTLVPASRSQQFVLARIRAVDDPTRARPRLTAILVLDVSGSMGGAPIDQVIQSTQRLADILSDDDALGVVAFSDGARTVSPVRHLSADARREVKKEIGALAAGGGTNMSGGIAHAALLFPSRTAGERHIALVLSDGQPNIGAQTPQDLADEVRRLKAREVALSALGFGAAHSEAVLLAIADAGGGRYAFVDDPRLAQASFARALGAQRDVVAEEVRLLLAPAAGVEIVRIFDNPPTSFAVDGLRVTLQDLIAGDELNVVIELRIDTPRELGPWRPLKLQVDARAAGTSDAIRVRGEAAVSLSHVGPFTQDETVLASVAIAYAEEMRAEARGLADRGNFAGAAAVLKKAKAMIEGTPGYVPGGARPGDPLHDAVETLIDEIAAMESRPDPEKYQAFRRAAQDYAGFAHGGTKVRGGAGIHKQSASAQAMVDRMLVGKLPHAALVVIAGPSSGAVHVLTADVVIGRSHDNAIVVDDAMVTRRHSRVVWNQGDYWVVDQGSSNGTFVNGARVNSHKLTDGDVLRVGATQLRFERRNANP